MHAVPLAITVVCTQDWCPVGGRPARVYLRRVALGVVEWPRLLCERCGCDMARKDDEEGSMAKITRHGGASDVNLDPPVAAPAAAEPAPVAAPPIEAESVPVEDVPAEQTTAAPEETDQAAEVPAEPPAPKPARGRGRPRKAA